MNNKAIHSVLVWHLRTLILCAIIALALSACQQPTREEREVVDPGSLLLQSLAQVSDLPVGYSVEYSLTTQEPVVPTHENHQLVEAAWFSFTTQSPDGNRLSITHQLGRHAQEIPISGFLELWTARLADPLRYAPSLSIQGKVMDGGCVRKERESNDLVVCEIVVNYNPIVSRLRIVGTDTRRGETIDAILDRLMNAIESRIINGNGSK